MAKHLEADWSGGVGVLPLRLVESRRERELSELLDDGSVVALEVHR